ncbi:MAG: hypothetical protein HY820_27125 [Acidobacteria bacterium]|nr:hypothetical protein [Acidobacteriota bacterium]
MGASASSIALNVLRQCVWIIGVWLLSGLPFAFLAARMADSLLWGVKSNDPSTYLIAAATLCIVGLVSG